MKLTLRAPAKINLFLRVTGKREDGYHELLTLFQMVGVYDELTVESRNDGRIMLTTDMRDTPVDRNIVFRAASMLKEAYGVKEGATISLAKGIPVAAGLGGGSSDAAATLIALNQAWNLGLAAEDLMTLGASIGSDVPFFFAGPAAVGRGRGELLQPAPALESWVVLINPGFPVSTAWVYGNLNLKLTSLPDNTKLPSFLKLGASSVCLGAGFGGNPESYQRARLSANDLQGCLYNSLEDVTERAYPEISGIKRRLLECGASAALMSGSGPTVFGLFAGKADAERAAATLNRDDWGIFVAPTLTCSPFSL